MAPVAPTRGHLSGFFDALVLPYAQVLFSKQRRTGAVLLLATFLDPVLGAFGLGAVALSYLVVLAAGFRIEQAREGLYGYNPLLVGLALATFLEANPATVFLVTFAVVATVLVQTALESALGAFFNLPVLSLPFVIVTFLALALVPMLPQLELRPPPALPSAGEWSRLPTQVEHFLHAIGAIFFSPKPLAGALVLGGVLASSRISILLAAVGFSSALVVSQWVAAESRVGLDSLAVNAVFTAIALGGIWFVPQPSAMLLAAVTAFLAVGGTLAAAHLLSPLGLPVLILPFNVTALLTLYAMRQRARDQRPKAVDFPAGSPETNLHYFRTRQERFGADRAHRFALPFSGRWTVTQAPGEGPTHAGAWSHAWDFEVLNASGNKHIGNGTRVNDFNCYNLPVLAVADGTVVRVVRDVPDNPVGERNPVDNWGNLVLIQHGFGLYSMVCHLAPGSVEVQEGQVVRQGVLIARCGNSGRSFVPHLHLQFQASALVGAPTIDVELSDVVTEHDDQSRLWRSFRPRSQETVRSLERRDDLARRLQFPIGAELRYLLTAPGGRKRSETITSRIDLANQLYLESENGARLYYEGHDRQFWAYDYVGSGRDILALYYAALARVPFEDPSRLAWEDVLMRRRFRSPVAAWVLDFVDPFLPFHSLALEFSASFQDNALLIHGGGRLGHEKVETLARITPDSGPSELRLTLGDRTFLGVLENARRLEAPP